MRRRFYTNKKNILPLYIEAKEDGVCFRPSTIGLTVHYRIDMGDWIALKNSMYSQSISKGQRLYIKNNTPFTFLIIGRCKIGGDIRSIQYSDNYKIFNGGSYARVFSNCTTIEEVEPNLLQYVTDLSDNCYESMFYGCTNLTTAPELPATTLADNCYREMFRNCTSLTTAPELPATTLESYCYQDMFRGCTKLNYIKMLATNISASNCLTNWVKSVASSGTFVKNPAMTSLQTATSSNYYAGIPSGWTVVNDGEEHNLVQFTTQFVLVQNGVSSNGLLDRYVTTKGTTWRQWIEGSFFIIQSDSIVSINGVHPFELRYSNSETVHPDDIIENHDYILYYEITTSPEPPPF